MDYQQAVVPSSSTQYAVSVNQVEYNKVYNWDKMPGVVVTMRKFKKGNAPQHLEVKIENVPECPTIKFPHSAIELMEFALALLKSEQSAVIH